MNWRNESKLFPLRLQTSRNFLSSSTQLHLLLLLVTLIRPFSENVSSIRSSWLFLSIQLVLVRGLSIYVWTVLDAMIHSSPTAPRTVSWGKRRVKTRRFLNRLTIKLMSLSKSSRIFSPSSPSGSLRSPRVSPLSFIKVTNPSSLMSMSWREGDKCQKFEPVFSNLQVIPGDIRNVDVVSWWTQIFVLFPRKNIQGNEMNLCMSMFPSLGGGHLHHFTWTTFDHDESSLSKSRTLHWVGGWSSCICTLKLLFVFHDLVPQECDCCSWTSTKIYH